MSGRDDDMILSYDVCLYGLDFSLRKWFFSLMTLHSSDSAPGPRWGTSASHPKEHSAGNTYLE